MQSKWFYPIVAGAFLLAIGAYAQAADLPVKKSPDVFNFQTSGWYIGAEVGAAVAQTSVSGQNLFATSLINGKLTAAGGTVGGCFGHVSGHALNWYAFHACVDWQNISASSPVDGAPASIASRWSATQEVRVGGNILSWITGILPNLGVTGFSFPTFTPPSVNGGTNLAASPHTYLAFGVNEFGVSGSFGSASGAKVVVAPMLKAGAIWQTLNSTGMANGGAIGTYAQVTFAGKGIAFDNVFASNGTLTANGNANMGTIYKAGVEYLFAVSSAYR